jgi:hypothetical protein
MDPRHNEGRPGVTRDAQGATTARERAGGGHPNVAQLYRSMGAKDRFLTRFRLQCGEPLAEGRAPQAVGGSD